MRVSLLLLAVLTLSPLAPVAAAASAGEGYLWPVAGLPSAWDVPGTASTIAQETMNTTLNIMGGIVETANSACAAPEAVLREAAGPVEFRLCRPDECRSWGDEPGCLVWSFLEGASEFAQAAVDALAMIMYYTVEIAASTCAAVETVVQEPPGPVPMPCRPS